MSDILDLMNPEAIARLRHTLRTPLNHIIGYAEMVRDEAEEQSRTPRRGWMDGCSRRPGRSSIWCRRRLPSRATSPADAVPGPARGACGRRSHRNREIAGVIRRAERGRVRQGDAQDPRGHGTRVAGFRARRRTRQQRSGAAAADARIAARRSGRPHSGGGRRRQQSRDSGAAVWSARAIEAVAVASGAAALDRLGPRGVRPRPARHFHAGDGRLSGAASE